MNNNKTYNVTYTREDGEQINTQFPKSRENLIKALDLVKYSKQWSISCDGDIVNQSIDQFTHTNTWEEYIDEDGDNVLRKYTQTGYYEIFQDLNQYTLLEIDQTNDSHNDKQFNSIEEAKLYAT